MSGDDLDPRLVQRGLGGTSPNLNDRLTHAGDWRGDEVMRGD